MQPQDQPRGSGRWNPPLKIFTGGKSKGVVVLNLHRFDEDRSFYQAFKKLKWRIVRPMASLEQTILDVEPDLVVTDDLMSLAMIHTQKVVFIAVIDDDDSMALAATEAGASFVVPRPINLDNPLGW